jgi:putative oxidoreductase
MDPTWIGHLLDVSGEMQLAARLVAIGHIAGGALLGLGLYTRLAAAVQVIPVFGALVLLHSHDGLASQNQSLEFSALVLIMLLFFAFFGAGQWSLDRRRAR